MNRSKESAIISGILFKYRLFLSTPLPRWNAKLKRNIQKVAKSSYTVQYN